ncbi:hypothetical protein WS70_21235 [Burkholderia mayonis]|uniref:Uncharacterized protein n=1 Tax=Burkholderia mayonis TaxID=1385591 RepID=A0A1B4FKZ9_9BURK|nr:hypothetical protein WS70_21235 [Burkholderia mayonis]KVE43959.1 hypothetical protein WS69_22105 [Burkholderia sp. BDU5]KVE49627.1 hypothetical protein WS70_19550 [Burkholderia mayonis]
MFAAVGCLADTYMDFDAVAAGTTERAGPRQLAALLAQYSIPAALARASPFGRGRSFGSIPQSLTHGHERRD